MAAKKSKKTTKTTKPKGKDVPPKDEEEIVESEEVKIEEEKPEGKPEEESSVPVRSVSPPNFAKASKGRHSPESTEDDKADLKSVSASSNTEEEDKNKVEDEPTADEEENPESEKKEEAIEEEPETEEEPEEEEKKDSEEKPKEEGSVPDPKPEVGKGISSELGSETNSVPESEPELSEETSERLESEEEEVPLEKKNTVLLTVGSVVGAIVITSSVWLLYVRSSGSSDSYVEEVAVQVVEPAESPTPSPSPSVLKRSEISIEVLNGSGVSGAAAANAETFEELGYEIFDIGNADDTEGNELYIDEGLEGQLDKLMEDVLEELDIVSISGYIEDSTVSARIILGS